MPRPRNPKNRSLPPNLYEDARCGFRYRRPDGVMVYLGFNRPAAIQAAISANAHFADKSSLFEKIVAGENKTLAQLIADYIEQKLPKADVTQKTKDNRRWVLQKIATEKVGGLLVERITTRDLHLYLSSLDASNWVRENRRALLSLIFNWSIQIGLRDDNPATALERVKAERSRQRLTYDVFTQLRSHCPGWLQNAMDLQLQTLQRPGDVLLMRWEDVQDDFLKVTQQKTGRRLKLRIEGALQMVLSRCRDEVLSPYIVHRRPQRLRSKDRRAYNRDHHSQVLITQAEREFARARKRSGLYTSSDSPPTLHEIRSLGASLYRQAGWREEEVQRLLGHNEIKMTRHYLNGHEAPWDEVAAGLKLP